MLYVGFGLPFVDKRPPRRRHPLIRVKPHPSPNRFGEHRETYGEGGLDLFHSLHCRLTSGINLTLLEARGQLAPEKY